MNCAILCSSEQPFYTRTMKTQKQSSILSLKFVRKVPSVLKAPPEQLVSDDPCQMIQNFLQPTMQLPSHPACFCDQSEAPSIAKSPSNVSETSLKSPSVAKSSKCCTGVFPLNKPKTNDNLNFVGKYGCRNVPSSEYKWKFVGDSLQYNVYSKSCTGDGLVFS